MCLRNTSLKYATLYNIYQSGTHFLIGFVLVRRMKTSSSSSEAKFSLCCIQTWYNRYLGDWDLGFLHFCTSCWNKYFLKALCISMEELVPLELQGGYLIWLAYWKHHQPYHSFHAVPSKGWRPSILSSWNRSRFC